MILQKNVGYVVNYRQCERYCSPRWPRGSGLNCGMGDPGSIPGLPSSHVSS